MDGDLKDFNEKRMAEELDILANDETLFEDLLRFRGKTDNKCISVQHDLLTAFQNDLSDVNSNYNMSN